jgi:hypothetical protein
MMVRLPLILILICCGFARPVFAEQDFHSGKNMLPHCKTLVVEDKPPRFWEGQCAGVIDALVWVRDPFLADAYRFCAPADIPPSQAHRVVLTYLEQHPEKLHQDFKGLAFEALQQAWPCPKKR